MSLEAAATAWRWGVWSPNDRAWYDTLRELGQAAEAVEEQSSPTIPLKIHQIWLGSREIPAECQAMMETWKTHHPAWEYRLWTDEDVDSVLGTSRLAAAFSRAESPAERSDILRLELILQFGGLYVDVDFECLRPLDGLHHRYSFYTGVSNVGVFELNNGLFAASPAHPLMRFLCENVARPWPEWGKQDVDPREAVAYQLEQSGMLGVSLAPTTGHAAFLATTGPGFFTRAVMRGISCQDFAARPVAVFPPDVFYPLPNSSRELPYEDRKAQAAEASLAMHHWFKTWAADERPDKEVDELASKLAAQVT